MKGNKQDRQKRALARIDYLLENPNKIEIEKTKKYRKGVKVSLENIINNLLIQKDILEEKLRLNSVP